MQDQKKYSPATKRAAAAAFAGAL
ncbi:MAG: hypothetical protein QOD39_4304, partial [Mycobacterium sp.]|nr:hypothetical protein [Mycobacterium sp.]